VERAARRGYPFPAAFMSSKPGAGINHKRYGVTSLGVIVFTHEILRALGIDPHNEPFTVKFTGGPRGDVAGNAMRLLMEDYGENARIVAVTDGHGAAWDPEGLDHAELSRLIRGERGIAEFDAALLRGAGAFVSRADTPEGVRRRNTLHNTAAADVFIPSGGRPQTINARNWEQFLDGSGHPTSRAIVEGANIFISPEARERLQEKGVLIVHGSSANKTGVICSSYEILGGLVMDEAEFMAVKDRYVAEVLDILRTRAADEARLMLRELKACDGCKPLTEITMELSKEINSLADRIYETLLATTPAIPDDPELLELLHAYCPPVLVERYAERIPRRVPERHLYALLAASTASRIVYAEGLGWLSSLARDRDVCAVARTYIRQEKKLAGYAEQVRRCGLDKADEVARILEAAGRKILTGEALGLGDYGFRR
jgi:glutamate dehydrogenase